MKRITAILTALLFALSAAACSQSSDPGTWTVSVETASGEKQFSSDQAKSLKAVSFDATIKNKNGDTTTSKYTGVKLSDILSAVGVSDFSTLTIAASDGYSADYDKDLAMKDDTILAWAQDGKPINSDPPLQMTPKTGTGNQFVKQVNKITVNP